MMRGPMQDPIDVIIDRWRIEIDLNTKLCHNLQELCRLMRGRKDFPDKPVLQALDTAVEQAVESALMYRTAVAEKYRMLQHSSGAQGGNDE